MSDFELENGREWAATARELRGSPLPEVQKLASAYDWITGRIITHAFREVEAARALGDEESAIRQQVKMETMRHARVIFEQCYMLATGRRAWDDQESL